MKMIKESNRANRNKCLFGTTNFLCYSIDSPKCFSQTMSDKQIKKLCRKIEKKVKEKGYSFYILDSLT